MTITGEQIIGSQFTKTGSKSFTATNPSDGSPLLPEFWEATSQEVDSAVKKAEEAFIIYRKKSGKEKAAFLEKIGEEIMALGDELIQRCSSESGLPAGRLTGERGRTVNQLNLFAKMLREGSWLDARIDTADPDRQPAPKPDIRQMHIAMGPVGVFGASNFPLAFSVAGGDTCSALAAGCTVVVKGHPAHPGTSELVGSAIVKAAEATGMPDGVFSLVQGATVEVGMAIVKHPLIKAIGFTGSFRGGKALFDEAAKRKEPIPVYAEMGSVNPLFVLPGAMKERGNAIAKGLAASVTMGVGQFCTNPGLVLGMDSSENDSFLEIAGAEIKEVAAGVMLTGGIKKAYDSGISKFTVQDNVSVLATGKPSNSDFQGTAYLLKTTAENFLANPELTEEVFGPATLSVSAESKDQLLTIANNLEGHLTATLHATEEDLVEYADLIAILERKVGRLIINSFPTGVEVCHAMVHGGPFPATTDSRTTSVGTAAIKRFSRPICYQGFPQTSLPPELQDSNPLDIWRLVNGSVSKETI